MNNNRAYKTPYIHKYITNVNNNKQYTNLIIKSNVYS